MVVGVHQQGGICAVLAVKSLHSTEVDAAERVGIKHPERGGAQFRLEFSERAGGSKGFNFIEVADGYAPRGTVSEVIAKLFAPVA